MRRSSPSPRLLLAAVALGTSGAVPLFAQTVTGSIVDGETGTPIATAYLALIGAEGSALAQTLSDGQGRFVLRAPAPGTFTLRAERIGLAAVVHGPFDLVEGETVRIELRAAVQAISLEGVEVEGRRQCVIDPEEAGILGTVWEQVRLALQVEALGRAEGTFRYRMEDRVRELAPDGRRVTAEQVRTRSGTRSATYVSAPVDELMEEGWVREDPVTREWVFYAPDAEVLLSDRFRNAHCFNLAAHPEDPALLGLAFEPVGGARGQGLTGTLWLARASAELRSLTFRYTGLPGGLDAGLALPRQAMGGEVEFLALPNGAFVVKRWHIRMPRIDETTVQIMGRAEVRRVLAGVIEEGGEVLEVRRVGGEVVHSADRPTGIPPTVAAALPEDAERARVEALCMDPAASGHAEEGQRLRRIDPGVVEGSVRQGDPGNRRPVVRRKVALVEEFFTMTGGWARHGARAVETETGAAGSYNLCARPFFGWDGPPGSRNFRIEVGDVGRSGGYAGRVEPAPWRVVVHDVVIPDP